MESRSFFEDVELLPPLEVTALKKQYKEDKSPSKVDLDAGGMYKNEFGKPHTMQVVTIAEKTMANDTSLTKEYIPPFGYEYFVNTAIKLLLGEDNPARMENRVLGIQTLASSGALRIAAEFTSTIFGKTTAYFSEQSWGHFLIFAKAGFKEIKDYRYWSSLTLGLDFNGLISDFNQMPTGSVVLLQNCCHNPTGTDPSRDQWVEIAAVVKERKLLVIFEAQFEGLASGDYDSDAWPIRYFAREKIEFFVCQCFSKLFGLYNERVGTLLVIMNSNKKLLAVRSQLDFIIRSTYANPPAHGARIVSFILGDQSLFETWQQEVKYMCERIRKIRQILREELERSGAPGKWQHLTDQKGIFGYTGLNSYQVEYLRKEYHIYMMNDGRINVCGLTPENVEYVAQSINNTLFVLPPENILKASYYDITSGRK